MSGPAVALVTGGGGEASIGAGIVAALRAAGVTVAVADLGPDAEIPGDVSTQAGASAAVAAVLERHGRLDVLVNNAGGGVLRPFLDHDEVSITQTIANNLLTTIHCSRAAIPHLPRGGRIINIGAESVRNGLALHAMYNAAKGGVHGLTSGLARELAPREITVNCVAPSIVATGAVQGMLANRAALGPAWNAMLDQAVGLIPLARPGAVEEVAAVVAFLASPAAAFVTGQIISVNGGSSML